MLKPKPSAICWSLLRPPPADVPPVALAVLPFGFKVLVEYIVVGFCDRTIPFYVTAFPALLYTVVITTTVGAGLPPGSVVVATLPTGTLQ